MLGEVVVCRVCIVVWLGIELCVKREREREIKSLGLIGMAGGGCNKCVPVSRRFVCVRAFF
jgi:hypothetical protein